MEQSYNFGEIVLLNFPFTNGIASKKRPALIIQDSNDGDIIVCRVTSQIYLSSFDIFLENWDNLGLKLPSIIRVHKIATLEKTMAEKGIGKLDESDKIKIKTKIEQLISDKNLK